MSEQVRKVMDVFRGMRERAEAFDVHAWAAHRLHHPVDGTWAEDAIHLILYWMEDYEPGQMAVKYPRPCGGGWGYSERGARINKEKYFQLVEYACQYVRETQNFYDATRFLIPRLEEAICGLTDEESGLKLLEVIEELSAH